MKPQLASEWVWMPIKKRLLQQDLDVEKWTAKYGEVQRWRWEKVCSDRCGELR